jgi:hypothetical protein
MQQCRVWTPRVSRSSVEALRKEININGEAQRPSSNCDTALGSQPPVGMAGSLDLIEVASQNKPF